MCIFAFNKKRTNITEIYVIDLNTNGVVWKKSFSLGALGLWAIGKNLVVTGSAITADKNATVYIYDLQSSNLLMSREFRKDHAKQRMVLSVMNDRAKNVSEYQNSVFLNIRRDDYYNIILLDPENNIEKWNKVIPLQAVQEGLPTIHVIESENKHYVFHQKGINLYLFSAKILFQGDNPYSIKNFIRKNDYEIISKKTNHSCYETGIHTDTCCSKHDNLKSNKVFHIKTTL